MANIVYIATSIDGFIADRNNKLDWLHMVPNPENIDTGFNNFLNGIDAILMGRNTFESIADMNIAWPYPIPVFVYSRRLKVIPGELKDKVSVVCGEPEEVTTMLNNKGYWRLYIDGGKTIQSFFRKDLIDQLTITMIPVLLGDGVPLFGTLPKHLEFKLASVKTVLGEMVCTTYRRKI